MLEPLFRVVRQTHPKADLRMLEQAYEIAEREHRGQVRKSGDPFITHPLAVTTILAELGMTPPTLCAALLHDTVEDTPYTLETLRADFGDEVAHLVDGVTKLDRVTYGESAQAETVRKMVVAMARDIRVLVIKLADRLHNMRTIKYVKPPSAERSARETLEIYAPLAHRLGMNTLKWELEDLAFATLYPKVYDEIVRLVSDRSPSRDDYLTGVIDQLGGDLKSAKIRSQVTGRPKHYYSIYQKMIVRGRDFADIYDLVGIRILVDSVRDCYAVLGSIHARWNPVPGRFKDYIAMPKFNMYQSLHTTVIGPEGKPVELQIRTFAMHRRAEYGVAAHWKYKEDPEQSTQVEGSGSRGGKGETSPGAANDMAWLRQLLDWQKETEDPGEFLESLRFDLKSAEVYVFTPKGDVDRAAGRRDPGRLRLRRAHRGRPPVHRRPRQRPPGAAGEHAGQRRPRRGLHLQGPGRRAEPRLADLRPEPAGPEQDPRLVLQGAPRGGDRAGQGRHHQGDAQAEPADPAPAHHRDPRPRSPTSCATRTSPALYAAIGDSHVSAQSVVARLVESLGGEEGATEDLAEVTTPGSRDPPAQRHRPGRRGQGRRRTSGSSWPAAAPRSRATASSGFVTRGSGVSVHRADCVNAVALAAPAGPDGRGRVGAVGVLGVPGGDPGRGAGPVPAAVRRHPGAVRPARQHPVGVGHDDPRPGRACPGSPSRWATPSTSATSCAPSAASTACSTSTGSPAARRDRGAAG